MVIEKQGVQRSCLVEGGTAKIVDKKEKEVGEKLSKETVQKKGKGEHGESPVCNLTRVMGKEKVPEGSGEVSKNRSKEFSDPLWKGGSEEKQRTFLFSWSSLREEE